MKILNTSGSNTICFIPEVEQTDNEVFIRFVREFNNKNTDLIIESDLENGLYTNIELTGSLLPDDSGYYVFQVNDTIAGQLLTFLQLTGTFSSLTGTFRELGVGSIQGNRTLLDNYRVFINGEDSITIMNLTGSNVEYTSPPSRLELESPSRSYFSL